MQRAYSLPSLEYLQHVCKLNNTTRISFSVMHMLNEDNVLLPLIRRILEHYGTAATLHEAVNAVMLATLDCPINTDGIAYTAGGLFLKRAKSCMTPEEWKHCQGKKKIKTVQSK